MKKGLIVKKYWLDKIFDEGKVWEMRSTRTNIRGVIALIEAGTGTIVGEVEIIGCSKVAVSKSKDLIQFHKVDCLELLDKWRWAWYLHGAKRYAKPIPYKHPKGAVIWVNLSKQRNE